MQFSKIFKGDVVGHAFHGNQFTSANGSADSANTTGEKTGWYRSGPYKHSVVSDGKNGFKVQTTHRETHIPSAQDRVVNTKDSAAYTTDKKAYSTKEQAQASADSRNNSWNHSWATSQDGPHPALERAHIYRW